ncbi:MAG TPA: hypothetical protein VFV42_02175 [Acidimicrobiales bacterium]|nr:hypothetical protein [Acidimicrobiales bacterium]
MAIGALTFVVWALESLFEYLHRVAWRNRRSALWAVQTGAAVRHRRAGS